MKRLNKKGFTLVELLAVIVVLALLMVVAASSIGTALDNSKKKALLTETQKLITNITGEAQSLKLMGSLNATNKLGSAYNGKDGDYAYSVTVNTHGYITALTVCYGTDYKAVAEITTSSDGYTTTVKAPATATEIASGETVCTSSFAGSVTISD